VRRSLAGVAAAVTCLVAVAFLIPLALLVGSVVRDRAMTGAFRTAAGIGPVLAVTTDRASLAEVLAGWPADDARRTSVYLPDGAGVPRLVLGPGAASPHQVAGAMRTGRPASVGLPDGAAAVQPVALPSGRIAVVEVDVPAAVLDRGVARARLLLGGLALLLVAGSLVVADRLGARVVRVSRGLAAAAGRLGAGDLEVRVRADGPVELREAAAAFNAMADRITALLAAERERAADLSHRLRTPLAGLVLAGRSLGPGLPGDQVRALTQRLEQEVDGIIADARRGPGRCEAVAVLRERLDFWGALAEDQGRQWRLSVPPEKVWLAVAAGELATAVDALVGNVFLHTPEPAAFTVRLLSLPSGIRLVVDDDGPGIAHPQRAVRRGISSAGSSGLGLDIVARLVEGCGGRLEIGRSDSGGARVSLDFPPAVR